MIHTTVLMNNVNVPSSNQQKIKNFCFFTSWRSRTKIAGSKSANPDPRPLVRGTDPQIRIRTNPWFGSVSTHDYDWTLLASPLQNILLHKVDQHNCTLFNFSNDTPRKPSKRTVCINCPTFLSCISWWGWAPSCREWGRWWWLCPRPCTRVGNKKTHPKKKLISKSDYNLTSGCT